MKGQVTTKTLEGQWICESHSWGGTANIHPASQSQTSHYQYSQWICLSEYVGIDIGSDVHILKAGDSLDFSSDRTNAVYNPGPTASSALLVIKNHRK